MTRFSVLVGFESDWACGTGRGRHGAVDLTVARDRRGLPHVPGKTLKGVWRDACETVARGLDEGPGGTWSSWVDHLFGAQATTGTGGTRATAGILAVRPATLHPAQERHLGAALAARPHEPLPPLAREHLVVQRWSTAITADGVADDDTLRNVERARAGLWLLSTCTSDGDLPWQSQLLLAAGARLVEHVGTSRRRGAGRCRLTLLGLPGLEGLLEEHADALAPGGMRQRPPSRAVDVPVVADSQLSPAGTPQRWRLRARVRLTTLLPVVVSMATRGNVVNSHDHVPGALLLPIVARALGPASTGLVRDGRLVVTDAHPVLRAASGTTVRALPTPRVLVSEQKGLAWRSDGRLVDVLTLDGPPGAVKPPREAWCAVSGPSGGRRVDLAGLPLEQRAHAVIDDQAGRPTADAAGGLYVYEAIPAGHVLEAEVWDDGCLDDLVPSLFGEPREVEIGRSRRDDYGLARLEVLEPAIPAGAAPVHGVGTCDLWLTADAILEGPLGTEPTADGLAAEAQRLLRREVQEVVVRATAGETTVRRRESWSGVWGLPRPSIVALRGGSVVRLEFQPPVPAAALERVLARGLGARRSEGFGRAAILDPQRSWAAAAGTCERQSADTRSDADPLLPGVDEQIKQAASDIAAQVWRRRVVDAVYAAGPDDSTAWTGASTATSAQRGTLRAAALRLSTEPMAVQRWIRATRARPSVLRRWGSAELERLAEFAAQHSPRSTLDLLGLRVPLEGKAREALDAYALQVLLLRRLHLASLAADDAIEQEAP